MRGLALGGLVVAVVVAVGVLAGAPVARAEVLQDLGVTFQKVAEDLALAFPKVETRIVRVEGERVWVQGAGAAALRPGLELTAYRRGGVFRHPVTGQPLGQSEEELAPLVVAAVTGEEAETRVVSDTDRPVPAVGDRARITAGRLSVAVLPPLGVTAAFETADQTALLLVARFSGLLEKTGRFVTADPQRVLDVAGVGGVTAPSPLGAARQLGVPAVLTSRLAGEGRARVLETAWISGRTGATIWQARTPLTRAVYPPRFAWEQTPELERRYQLAGPVRALAVADLLGDRPPVLVVADDRAVTAYRWQAERGPGAVVGEEFRPGGVILSADAVDVNGAGRAQLVVVDHQGAGGRDAVRSRVLELVDERWRTLYEIRGHYLRVVRVGRENWLLQQEAGRAEPFAPQIRRLAWQDGRYQEGPTLRVPAGVSVYGLALMRLTGSPEPEVVALTPEDRLSVWTARGQRLWTSPTPYGGAAVSFAYTPQGIRDVDVAVGRILGRIVPLPEGPSGPEVLVFENLLPAGGTLRSFLPRLSPIAFTEGRVDRLRWKDGAFVPVWQSRITDGYVADFTYGELNRDVGPEVLVAVVPRGFTLDTLNPLGRPKSYLVLYELP